MNKTASRGEIWRSSWIWAALIVLLTLLAYLPALKAGFIWDDDAYVTHNHLLTAPDGLFRIWFSFDSPSQYFPLTYTSLRIDRTLWGLNPFGYHLINVLLHSANALLVWALLIRLKIPGAWLAAAIFALHPVQVESVAWITERKNLLMCFFFLLSLLAWSRFIELEDKKRWMFYVLGLLSYCLALTAKTTACTLPAALLLVLWLQNKRIDWRRLLQVTPFVLLGFAMGLISMWWERFHSGTSGPEFGLSAVERLLVAAHAVWFYAAKLFWPTKLTFIYPKWNIDPSNAFLYGWIAAGLAACALIYFARRRFGRGPEVAIAFFVATLAPVSGPIMLYTFRYTFVADHYQYVASIGLIALAAAAGVTLSKKLELGWKAVPLAAILLFVLGACTWRQSRIYYDGETVWRDTVAKNPGSWLAHLDLGVALNDKGETDAAKSEYDQALSLKPDAPETINAIGVWDVEHGQVSGGIEEFREALRIFPNYAFAAFNLGNALVSEGRLEEAIAWYLDAIRVDRNYAEAHGNVAVALSRAGKFDEAVAHFKEAIRLNPGDAASYNNFGALLAQQNRFDEAVEQYRIALQLNKMSMQTYVNLARALNALGRNDEAVAQLQQALRLDRDYSPAKQLLHDLGANEER